MVRPISSSLLGPKLSCFIQAKVERISLKVLVDTGSPFSFVSKCFLDSLSTNNIVSKFVKGISLRSANNSLFSTNKMVLLELVIQEKVSRLWFYVIDSPVYVILGMDILKGYKGVLFSGSDDVSLVSCLQSVDRQGEYTLESMLNSDLADPVRNSLLNLLKSHEFVFSANAEDIGYAKSCEFSIDTGTSEPCKQRPYKVAECQRAIIKTEVEKMLRLGVIRPSCSSYCSPVTLVSKKDGSYRFCVNLKRLNDLTVTDNFPVPDIDVLLRDLKESTVFSELDLTSAYWQFGISENDKRKTAFIAEGRLWEFERVPFGAKNAPAFFQRALMKLLGDLPFCKVFLDNIIIHSNSNDEHLLHLSEVFKRISSDNLKLKPNKCNLFCKKIKILGYYVSRAGIESDPDKVRAIKEFTTPSNVTELRRFLGMLQCFNKFCPQLSEIASPLYRLTSSKIKFLWTDEHNLAFQNLKEILTSTPILRFPDFSKKFRLSCDASGIAIGSVLMQKYSDGWHPVAFGSKNLSDGEKRYSTIDRELLAIQWSVSHFRSLLLGHNFEVFTDHKPILGLFNSKNPTSRQQRLMYKLSEYSFELKYCPGKENLCADALSRICTPMLFVSNLRENIIQSQKSDEKIQRWILYLTKDGELLNTAEDKFVEKNKQNYIFLNDILYFDNSIVVPKCLQDSTISEFHGVGHYNADRTRKRLQGRYWWYGLPSDVTNFVKRCAVCSEHKIYGACRSSQGRIPAPGPFEVVFLDIVVMPKHGTYSYILTMEDSFTKWVEAVALSSISADNVAKHFLNSWIYRFGPPVQVHSDKGTQFESDVFQSLCRLIGSVKTRTTPYHPEGNSSIERFHRTVKDRIRTMSGNWVDNLAGALFAYRTSFHSSIDTTPFNLTYGFTPQILADWPQKFRSAQPSSYVSSLRAFWNASKHSTLGSPGMSNQKFKVGDHVRVRRLASCKMDPPWSKPAAIEEVLGPTTLRIKNFGPQHINRLKKVFV